MAISRRVECRVEWRVELNVEVSLVLQLLFVIQTLKNVFVGIFRDAAWCKRGKVVVMVWAEDGHPSGRILIKGE